MLAYRALTQRKGRLQVLLDRGVSSPAILPSTSFTDPLRLLAECEIGLVGLDVVCQKPQTSASCCGLLHEYAARIEC